MKTTRPTASEPPPELFAPLQVDVYPRWRLSLRLAGGARFLGHLPEGLAATADEAVALYWRAHPPPPPARTPPPDRPVTVVLTDLLAERADQLHQLAARLRAVEPGDQLPPHRLLQLAAVLLGELGDVERSLHELTRWLPEEGGQ